MTREELLERLQSIEWDDIEFKEASWAAPKSALSSVSAFANTTGGYLVFGIREARGAFTVSGVIEADKVQNDFLGQVRDRNKISILLPIESTLHALDDSKVIVFYIPEAGRSEKPVFLDRNPKKAFIRRGGRDDTCTPDELMRFMRDAAADRYDAEPLDLNVGQCFDRASVRWYRERFATSNPGKYGADDDARFLRKWGFLVERGGHLLPTRAAILVLGADEYVRQVLPRMTLDLHLYLHTAREYSAGLCSADARQLAQRLAVQVILQPADNSPSQFALAEHLRARFAQAGEGDRPASQHRAVSGATRGVSEPVTAQVTEQAAQAAAEHIQALVQLTDTQWQIVRYADVPRSLLELMTHSGYSQRSYFKARYIEPLLAGGILRMTVPHKPRSSKQRYVLTATGLKLRVWYADQQADK